MTTKPVHSVPDAWRRVLVLHAYPPDPRLHTFERGLRQLGHDVVAAGPPSDTVPIEAWREVDAELTYVSVDPEASLDEVFAATGGVPDWVLYLRPPTAFLPRGLRDCPVPTVAWFEEEFRYLGVPSPGSTLRHRGNGIRAGPANLRESRHRQRAASTTSRRLG